MTKFVAIDFETANADLASVCQIGIAVFEDGKFKESWGTLVNPKVDFDWMNISIHGIDESKVQNSPAFHEVYETVASMLRGSITVCHTSFDRTALSQTLRKHSLPEIECRWLDSAKVVRRTWEKWSRSGYGLINVCLELGIQYKAHDAVEDARAAGEVLIRAMSEIQLDLDGLFLRVNKPVDPLAGKRVSEQGNPDGPLIGEELVFTGALTIPRREAAIMAANVGCDVTDTVKKSTTVLVVGDQDILKLAGHEKSTKHRKAEELIRAGRAIRILRESDFMQLVEITKTLPSEYVN